MRKRVAIIGAGFSGLSAACFLAAAGYDVTVFEKHKTPGGRARQFVKDRFTFDMGPSWYWMPDVFERFFAHFGKRTDDYYTLTRVDPSYRIIFGQHDFLDVPASRPELAAIFEALEPGSSRALTRFLAEAETKYFIAMDKLVYRPFLSPAELFDRTVLRHFRQLSLLQSMSSHVRKRFRNERLRSLLTFPVLFLGGRPNDIPALYSFMNYADIVLGTWYPQGGMFQVVKGLSRLAAELGVSIKLEQAVQHLYVRKGRVNSLVVNGEYVETDYVVATADYHHVDQELLAEGWRTYTPAYWSRRVMAPSALIFYVGLRKKIQQLRHHTLFMDSDFARHADAIYRQPEWPLSPQFYVNCASRTDNRVSPEGMDALSILIPVAPGLQDSDTVRQHLFAHVIDRMGNTLGEDLSANVAFTHSYGHNDFRDDYNAYKGNAYGLANTLGQTAFLKPRVRSQKVKNLFYAGHLTVPGPGVPPALISGEVAAKTLIKSVTK